MLTGVLHPAPNTSVGVGVDVGDQSALLGTYAELEVDDQDGAGCEWAARHPSASHLSPGAALSLYLVMAMSWLVMSLPSPNPSTWHPSQASSQSTFYACAQHWPQSGQPQFPVLVG